MKADEGRPLLGLVRTDRHSARSVERSGTSDSSQARIVHSYSRITLSSMMLCIQDGLGEMMANARRDAKLLRAPLSQCGRKPLHKVIVVEDIVVCFSVVGVADNLGSSEFGLGRGLWGVSMPIVQLRLVLRAAEGHDSGSISVPAAT